MYELLTDREVNGTIKRHETLRVLSFGSENERKVVFIDSNRGHKVPVIFIKLLNLSKSSKESEL